MIMGYFATEVVIIPDRSSNMTLMLVIFVSLFGVMRPLRATAQATHTLDFIQITDPHLFDAGADQDTNKAALQWALSAVDWYGNHEAKASFLAFTGDCGLDCVQDPHSEPPPASCGKTALLHDAVDLMANYLDKVGLPIYFVPGNNDLVNESSCDIAHYRDFIGALQESLRTKGSKTTVMDLTNAPAPISGLRIVGLNSASFKNADKYDGKCITASKSNDTASSASNELQKFSNSLTHDAAGANLPALVFTHEPDIQDPFRMIPIWSAEISDVQAVKTWYESLCKNSVLAVFAGHLHSQDFNKYGSPIMTTGADCGNGRTIPTLIAPPISAKNQNPMAPEARGLLWVRIKLDDPYSVSVTPLWYARLLVGQPFPRN
jgi:3',5'-cyclic AMP phosphodiesterase CpdA